MGRLTDGAAHLCGFVVTLLGGVGNAGLRTIGPILELMGAFTLDTGNTLLHDRPLFSTCRCRGGFLPTDFVDISPLISPIIPTHKDVFGNFIVPMAFISVKFYLRDGSTQPGPNFANSLSKGVFVVLVEFVKHHSLKIGISGIRPSLLGTFSRWP